MLFTGVSFPAFAHGEQALVFPGSLGLLVILALVIVAVPWHRWWARAIAAIVLLASNVALWFSPLIPQTSQGLANANLDLVMLTLLIVPMVIAAAVAGLMLRVWPRRAG